MRPGIVPPPILLGLRVTEARADNPDPVAAGHVRIPHDEEDLDQVRRFAVSVLAGRLPNTDWPPVWPPDPDSWRGDERQLAAAAKTLGLDRAGWDKLVSDTYDLWALREFDVFEQGLTHLLEDGHVLDEHTIRQIHRISREAGMEHLLTKAVVTDVTTDAGEFEAVISTASVDREGDIVDPEAMVSALKAWNRPIPLSWNHSSDARDIIGAIQPETVRVVDAEVLAGGQVDLDSEMGQEAWRSFKSRTIGFSFGYLIPDGGSTARKGGGRHITQLDVFEITATPTPMNNDTRTLFTKAVDPRYEQIREQAQQWMTEILTAPTSKTLNRQPTPPAKRERAPIQIKTFEVA